MMRCESRNSTLLQSERQVRLRRKSASLDWGLHCRAYPCVQKALSCMNSFTPELPPVLLFRGSSQIKALFTFSLAKQTGPSAG